MKNLIKVFGIAAFVAAIGFSMAACDNSDPGDTDLPPEQLSTSERWSSWADPNSTATITHSVADDGVCTITIGGTAEANSWDDWKANAAYSYTAKKDTGYSYTFEAWTASGTRNINVQYYWDDADSLGLQDNIALTTTEKSFTVTGDAIPKAGVRALSFRGANQIGTFYVKIISITEANTDPKTLVLQGVPQNFYSDGVGGDGGIGIFSIGTTYEQALDRTNLVAGAEFDNSDIVISGSGGSTITATIPLYLPVGGIRWNGSGQYQVYSFITTNGSVSKYFNIGPVNFVSATTIVTYRSDMEVSLFRTTF